MDECESCGNLIEESGAGPVCRACLDIDEHDDWNDRPEED